MEEDCLVSYHLRKLRLYLKDGRRPLILHGGELYVSLGALKDKSVSVQKAQVSLQTLRD